MAALDDSDVFVFVEIGSLRSGSLLSFMAATPMGRLVRVSLNFRDVEPDTIGWLGHELQHAAQDARAAVRGEVLARHGAGQ